MYYVASHLTLCLTEKNKWKQYLRLDCKITVFIKLKEEYYLKTSYTMNNYVEDLIKSKCISLYK